MGTPDAIRLAVRTDLFGLTNYVGLVATALVVLLLALSNDRSLRRLGVKRWKAWQRSSYVLCALTVGHGAVYQLVEKRQTAVVLLFVLVVAGIASVQLLARREVIRQRGEQVP